MSGRPTRRGLGTVWHELGRLGRIGFLGIVVSGIVAVLLGFLIPSAVRDHLVTARVHELQRAVDAVVESSGTTEFTVDTELSAFAAAARLRLLGGDTVRVKLWDRSGRILWSDEDRLIDRRFNLRSDVGQAFAGEVSVEQADLTDLENEFERGFGPLMEFYIPVVGGDGEIAAVFEVYQRLDPLDETLAGVKASTWIRIGSGLGLLTLFMGALTLATLRGAERRRQESEMLLRRSLEVRETERVRLATALHDDVGQVVYRLLYGLEALKDSQLDTEAAANETQRLGDLARQLDVTLRDEMQRLQTSPVDQQGLRTSLLGLASSGESPPVIDVDTDMDRSLGFVVEEALYRAAREGVANAVKHSGATTIEVRLRDLGHAAELSVVDDGQWQNGPKGLGIATVRSMLDSVDGDLDIRSNSAGTTLVARVPLSKETS